MLLVGITDEGFVNAFPVYMGIVGISFWACCNSKWWEWYYCRIYKFLHDRPWISPWIKWIFNELDIIIHVIASQLSDYCDVISNRLWRHQQNEDRESGTWERCVKIVVFVINYGHVRSCKKYNNVCTLVTNCFCAHSSVTFVFIYINT